MSVRLSGAGTVFPFCIAIIGHPLFGGWPFFCTVKRCFSRYARPVKQALSRYARCTTGYIGYTLDRAHG